MRFSSGLLLLLVLSTPRIGHTQGTNDNNDNITCAAEDRDGGALEDTFLSSADLTTCVYSTSGECTCITADGSFSSGTATCAQGILLAGSAPQPRIAARATTDAFGDPFEPLSTLMTAFPAEGPGPPLSRFTATLNASFVSSTSASASSVSLPATQMSSIPQASGIPTTATRRNRVAPGIVAGIVVAISLPLLCLAMVLWFRRRRLWHRVANPSVNRAAATISPFTLLAQVDTPAIESANLGVDSDTRSISSAITRQHLETQLLVATEKMEELVDQERVSVASATSGSDIRRIWRSMLERTASTRQPPDLEAQLHVATEWINMLVARINALEANADSAWGRANDDEPPPEYV